MVGCAVVNQEGIAMHSKPFFRHLLATLSICFLTFCTLSTQAAPEPMLVPPPPRLDAKGYVLMDAKSGKILAQHNMNKQMAPASLTKLMTLYIVEKQLQLGQIKLDDKVRVSKKAWRTGGSRMFLKVGSHVPISDLVEGIIVASGNDATMAIAEYIGGTEMNFVQLMNQTAQQLGMKNTHYADPTGLPAPNHHSTPYDLALLASHVINDYPQYYHWYKQKWIKWSGIKQPNRNRLLWRDPYVDGLKTGHTEAAGYCLISSAKQDGMRLISVVMGTPTDAARANESQALLNWGFRFYKNHKLFNSGEPIARPRIWLGAEKYAAMGVSDDVYVTIPAGQYKNLKANLKLEPKLTAPITKGQQYGVITITLKGKTVKTIPVVALQDDAQGGLWTRFTDRIALIFKSWFSKV